MKKITFLAVVLLLSAHDLHSQCTDVALPYFENFDTALPPDLPDCTYSYKQTFVGSDWECITAPNTNFTGNVGRYSTYSDAGWGMWCDYILRSVQLTAGMGYKISYKYAHDDNDTAIDAFRLALFSNNQPTTLELASHEQVTGTEVINFSTEIFTVPTTGNYYIRFTIESAGNQGILYLDDIKVEEMGIMAANDTVFSQMSLYPNPVKESLTITNTNSLETLELYTITGQLVLKQPAADTTTIINLDNLPSGIYILKTSNQQASKTMQLIKE